jgi:hypothetical protein
MTRLDLLNRALTAAVLVALAVTLGVWLTRSPLTAAPLPVAPAPVLPTVKPAPAEALATPTLAPLPLPAPATTTTEVQVEVEIAPLPIPPATPVVADPPPAAPPAAKPAEPQNTHSSYQGRGRGLFRRR